MWPCGARFVAVRAGLVSGAGRLCDERDLDDPATKSALDRSDVRRRPDNDYAVAWVRRFGGGRVFYTSFGHDERAWLNGPTLKHILGGIQYALRDISTDETPSSPQFVNPPSKK